MVRLTVTRALRALLGVVAVIVLVVAAPAGAQDGTAAKADAACSFTKKQAIEATAKTVKP